MDTALVTGADRGIGLQISRQLVELGYRVYGLAADFSGCDWQHHDFMQVVCDLSRAEHVKIAWEHIAQHNPQINAVVYAQQTPAFADGFEGAAAEDIAYCVHSGLIAPLLLTRWALPSLVRFRGYVISIGWNGEGTCPLGAAAAAIEGGRYHWMQSLFEELRDTGVKVCSIYPQRNGGAADPKARLKLEPQSEVDAKFVAKAVAQVLQFKENNLITQLVVRPQGTREEPRIAANVEPLLSGPKDIVLPDPDKRPPPPLPIPTPEPSRPADAWEFDDDEDDEMEEDDELDALLESSRRLLREQNDAARRQLQRTRENARQRQERGDRRQGTQQGKGGSARSPSKENREKSERDSTDLEQSRSERSSQERGSGRSLQVRGERNGQQRREQNRRGQENREQARGGQTRAEPGAAVDASGRSGGDTHREAADADTLEARDSAATNERGARETLQSAVAGEGAAAHAGADSHSGNTSEEGKRRRRRRRGGRGRNRRHEGDTEGSGADASGVSGNAQALAGQQHGEAPKRPRDTAKDVSPSAPVRNTAPRVVEKGAVAAAPASTAEATQKTISTASASSTVQEKTAATADKVPVVKKTAAAKKVAATKKATTAKKAAKKAVVKKAAVKKVAEKAATAKTAAPKKVAAKKAVKKAAAKKTATKKAVSRKSTTVDAGEA